MRVAPDGSFVFSAEEQREIGLHMAGDPEPDEDDLDFADPGGRSALRASSRRNPRNLPCPNCGKKNRLTPADRARHYQCDECADRAEGLGFPE